MKLIIQTRYADVKYFESSQTENYKAASTPMITSGFLDASKTTVNG